MVIIMRDHKVLRKALGCLLGFLRWCLLLYSETYTSSVSAHIGPGVLDAAVICDKNGTDLIFLI